MNILMTVWKSIVNVVLFCFYSLIGIFLENFIFWLILTKLLNKNVPGSKDPVHLQLAVFTIILIFIITFFLRKYLYLSVKQDKSVSSDSSEKNTTDISEEQKMEIFIDKEIK